MKSHHFKLTDNQNKDLHKIKMKVELPDDVCASMVLCIAKMTGVPPEQITLTQNDVIKFIRIGAYLYLQGVENAQKNKSEEESNNSNDKTS